MYPYTLSSTLGTPTSTTTYTYGDSQWKDKLTQYGSTTITYDEIGNPLNYRNGTLSWQNGRQLARFTGSNGPTTYTYNANGIRIGKASSSRTVEYTLDGTTIVAEKVNGNTRYFIYDDKGAPTGIIYNNKSYIFRKNIQGDILGIIDGENNEIVTYTYDAWGRLLSTTGSMATTLGGANPFRYLNQNQYVRIDYHIPDKINGYESLVIKSISIKPLEEHNGGNFGSILEIDLPY